MRARFEILVLGALCSMVVSGLTHAQSPIGPSIDDAIGDIAQNRPEDETSTVPTSEPPHPDSSLLSDRDSTERPGTTPAIDSRQREQFERALPHIIKAEGLFENDIFEAAAAEYKRAGEILKGHPKYYQTQYNLGLCYERLFRYTEALEYYENYLKYPELETSNRIEAERLVKTLRELLATLQISVNVRASLWIDGRLIGQVPGELLVAGGKHRVELRADGYETEQLEVRTPPQIVRKLAFQMRAIGRFQGIHPIYFWASSALAVTTIGIGSYFGINFLSERQNAQKIRNAFDEAGSEPEDGESDDLVKQLQDANRKIDDLEIKADIFFAVGAGFVLSSVILYFLTDWSSPEEAHAASRVKQPNLSFTTRVSHQGVYGTLTGSFEIPFF